VRGNVKFLKLQCYVVFTHLQCSASFIFCTGDANGNIKALLENPAVRSDVLSEIFAWKQEGATLDDVVTRLRVHTVPSGYAWIDGKYTYSKHQFQLTLQEKMNRC